MNEKFAYKWSRTRIDVFIDTRVKDWTAVWDSDRIIKGKIIARLPVITILYVVVDAHVGQITGLFVIVLSIDGRMVTL